MSPDLLTASQLAQRLTVKTRTVQQWQRSGLIPAVRLSAKIIRYDLEKVVDALERRQPTRKAVDHA